MNIVMVGSGYVGLVSGACFADFGHNVTCVDKDAGKIDALKAGRIPIYEPGLAEIVAKNSRSGQLAFTTELSEAVAVADAVFIAVGTPSRRGDGHADLSYVHEAAREIEAWRSGEYQAGEDELRAIDEAIAQLDRGEVASEAEVKAAFAKFRSA